MTAAAPGVVTSVVDLGSRSYGRYVIVDHGSGWSTLYAHLLSQWVTVGQSVDQGQIIGQVGSTGGSTGPHLHFEERMNRRDLPSYFHRVTFRMGSTQASTNCGDTVVPGGDWNRDGTEEPALFRRGKAAKFILRRTGTTPLRRALRAQHRPAGQRRLERRRPRGRRRPAARLEGVPARATRTARRPRSRSARSPTSA